MVSKIAILNRCNFMTSPSEAVITATLYEKPGASWNETDTFYVNMSASDPAAARLKIKNLIDRLGDCSIAAGPSISGLLYRELDTRGISVFEVPDCGPETLDGILSDLEDALALSEPEEVPKRPVETETPGVYYLDLVRLQETCPELTSKQALREFLETVPFYELRLTCSHVPPWLEDGPYEIAAQASGSAVVATVRKKQCGGGCGQ